MPEQEKKNNWFVRHKLLTVIIVIVVIMVIGGSKGDNSSNSPSSTTESKQEEATANFKMNELVTSGDLAFIVTKMTEAKSLGNAYTSKDAQGIFKIITIDVENVGKETKMIDSSMIKLKDDQDRTFERSIDGQTAKGLAQGQFDLFLQQVQPGLSVTGEIVFDIPADATGLVLQVKDSIFGKSIDIMLE